jgi:uncharacterized protein YihD (DUF1040 family)
MLYIYIYVVYSLWVFKGKENTHTTLTYTSKSPKKKKEHGVNLINYTLKISLDKGLDNYIQNLIMVIANYKLKFKKRIATSKTTLKIRKLITSKNMY